MSAEPRHHRRYPLHIAAELGSWGRHQVLETEDLSVGGCRLVVLFPLHGGDQVRVRLRSNAVRQEPSGSATVAWATREPPYRVGLSFDEALVAQMPAFLQALIGGPVEQVAQEGQG